MAAGHLLLPRTLKLAAGYFLAVGAVGLVWPLLGLGPWHPEFEAKSFAYKLGTYLREGLIDVAFIAAGVSIFTRRSWAPYLAYLTLAIATFYTAHQFGWGFAGRQPSGGVLASSFVVVGTWNALWAYLVFRNRAALQAAQRSEPAV